MKQILFQGRHPFSSVKQKAYLTVISTMKKARPLCLGALALSATVTFLASGNRLCAAEAEREFAPLNVSRDEASLNREDSRRITSFADVVEPVTPSVVSVFSTRTVEVDPRRAQVEEFLRRMYGMAPEAETDEDDAPEMRVEQGMGTGFVVSQDGYILTNHHVVFGGGEEVSDDITVKLPDGREFEAEFVGSDAATDIAVLKIHAVNLPSLTLGDSEQLRVGDIVFAVGNPLDVGLTVTSGIVSALERTDLQIPGGPMFQSFIQTDAAINFGNSGGPLIDAEGRVIGINTAILSTGYRGGSIGIGFAIPVNLAYKVMNSLIDTGEVRRGFVGLQLGPLTRDMAKAFGLDSTKGALVERVMEGLPAYDAGIKHGDIILTLDGTRVDTPRELIYLISGLSPGDDVSVGLMRWGENMDVSIVLGDRQELLGHTVRVAAPVKPQPFLDGIFLKELTPDLRETYEISDASVKGLVVTEVEDDSAYAEQFTPGMVIAEINGKPATDLAAAKAALRDGPNACYVYLPEVGFTYLPLVVED